MGSKFLVDMLSMRPDGMRRDDELACEGAHAEPAREPDGYGLLGIGEMRLSSKTPAE